MVHFVFRSVILAPCHFDRLFAIIVTHRSTSKETLLETCLLNSGLSNPKENDLLKR